MNKNDLREQLKNQRNNIPSDERHQAATQAANLFASSLIFQKSTYFAGYLAQKNEFDCMPLLETILQANKKCYLPCLTSEKTLEFGEFKIGDELRPNRFGILEPVSEIKISPAGLDVVVLPLIGFDQSFNRLGTGGGYYDRTFSFVMNSMSRRPLLIGLGYSFQEVNNLVSDSWDVPLSGILTEKLLRLSI